MKEYYFEHGPNLAIEFEVENNAINKSTILSKTAKGTVCKLKGDHTLALHTPSIVKWMQAYCAGSEPDILLPLNFSVLSSFAAELLKALTTVAFGEITTYKDLAVKVGSPRAARAVGNVCANNPFHLIVPCHRVIKSSGELGGFTIDLSIKTLLLDFES